MNSVKMLMVANQFRKGLEKYFQLHPEKTFSTNFMDPLRGKFPTDHCKAASFAFACYLVNELNYPQSKIAYIWGTRNSETHGWLKCGDYFVDLTADQFPDNHNPVLIVTSSSSKWHNTFSSQRCYPYDLNEDHPFRELEKEVSELIKLSPAT